MFATLLFVLMFALTAGEAGRCQLGFINLGQGCYLFSHNLANFAEANSFCLFFGSHLADITSKKEDDFIRSYLLLHGQGSQFYIGATDLRSEGIWTWEHPLRKVVSYTNWYPGEPNNHKGKEHCVTSYHGYSFKWNDIPCNSETNVFNIFIKVEARKGPIVSFNDGIRFCEIVVYYGAIPDVAGMRMKYPLRKVPVEGSWYGKKPRGENALNKMMKMFIRLPYASDRI